MIKRMLLSKKGSILFIVTSICALLALGAGLNAALFSSEALMSRYQIDSFRAFQLAETGIDCGFQTG